MGLLGVGFASSLAGHAGSHAPRALALALAPCGASASASTSASTAAPRRGKWWKLTQINADEALLDAVLGIVIFKLAGGRFSSLMPSDLAAPGALAYESIPAAGGEYAPPAVKRELVRIFRRDGCHHCGEKDGVGGISLGWDGGLSGQRLVCALGCLFMALVKLQPPNRPRPPNWQARAAAPSSATTCRPTSWPSSSRAGRCWPGWRSCRWSSRWAARRLIASQLDCLAPAPRPAALCHRVVRHPNK
jgi:hypothetical protein